MDKLIVSMTTIPSRFKRLEENLPSLLEYQTYKVEKLRINLDDCLSEEQLKPYKELQEKYHQIELGTGEKRWRSCNKLLPTVKDYPDAVIITVDDDIYYKEKTIETLVKEYETNQDCIIAQEVNPIVIEDEKWKFLMSYDVMMKQKEWGKYLSNCALYPPHTFDGTDLYDYDKMHYCTDSKDDELWFCINSTLNGVQCIGLNYYHSLAPEVKTPYSEGEYQLTDSNKMQDFIDWKCDRVNELYGERLIKAIESKCELFTITNDNVYTFLYLRPFIRNLYPNAEVVFADDVTTSWRQLVIASLKDGRYRI